MRVKLLALALAISLGGCSTAGYYWQAFDGHWEVMRAARPILDIVSDPATSESMRKRLELVREIRDFASRELALPDNGSYKDYADLGRPFVVWNVFAAPAFSTRPVESCFPIAGCVAYRGFYSEAKAREHAQSFASVGHDTYVAGVPAYSTLGWFNDPVLSTFVNYPEAELARVIFHELAHQVVYVRDDSRFNESFAVAVEEEGLRRWLEKKGGIAAEQELQRWREARQRRGRITGLLLRFRDQLEAAYTAAQGDAEKRAAKTRLFDALQQEYAKLKTSWDGFSGYDRFFVVGSNNAMLSSIALYTDYVPAFAAMIARTHGNMQNFYADVRRLANRDRIERTALLTSGASNALPGKEGSSNARQGNSD